MAIDFAGGMCYTALTFLRDNRRMKEPGSRVDGRHRKELLRFLLVKTAAVRRGVKPGELLRVRHCYSGMNVEGRRVCLYRSDIYGILGLDHVELKVEEASSLVLFYNPSALEATLAEPRNARWLARMGYPAADAARMPRPRKDVASPSDAMVHAMLAHLVRRAATCDLPHEVGVFIGYPLKDVAGFMRRIPATPVHHGAWRVYGSAAESLARMRLYARAEADACEAFRRARGVDDFIDMISLDKAS